jgi:hypothetical protein
MLETYLGLSSSDINEAEEPTSEAAGLAVAYERAATA